MLKKMNLQKKLREGHASLVKAGKFKILRDYRGTYIEEQMRREETMVSPIFRVFDAVKPSKKRKLNIEPRHAFDPYTDSLFDYPSIIGHRLQQPWENFNRLIGFQIPLCPNDCWHCYLPKELYVGASRSEDRYELLTAQEITSRFLQQREIDLGRGKQSNVLRITGGEPFLLPELILDCLKALSEHEKGKSKQLFLWSETNLEPFVGAANKAFMDTDGRADILREMREYTNFAVHPCFHGLDDDEFDSITGRKYGLSLNDQLRALDRLVDAGIDVYPTIGSNVCNPRNLEALFQGLREIHPNLPLRLALVEYDLDYQPVEPRFACRKIAHRPKIYSRFASLRIWDRLLLQYYGVGYSILPRHLVDISEEAQALSIAAHTENERRTSADVRPGSEVIFAFKGSYRDSYHRESLDFIGLPNGSICEVPYDDKWVQNDLFFHMSLAPEAYENRKVIWSYVDRKTEKFTLLPFRVAKILKVSKAGKVLLLTLELGDLIAFRENGSSSISERLLQYFGKGNTPPGQKYLLLGEDLFTSPASDRKAEGVNLSPAFRHGCFESSADLTATIQSSFEVFRRIVDEISLAPDMARKNLFYRIEVLDARSRVEDGRRIYSIKGGKAIRFRIEYYLPNFSQFPEKRPEERTIYCATSSDVATPIGRNEITLSKYGNEIISFRTNEVKKKERATITFFSKEHPFFAPKIDLVIDVEPPSRRATAGRTFLGAILFSFVLGMMSVITQARTSGGDLVGAVTGAFAAFFTNPPWLVRIENLLVFIFVAVVILVISWVFPRGLPVKLK